MDFEFMAGFGYTLDHDGHMVQYTKSLMHRAGHTCNKCWCTHAVTSTTEELARETLDEWIDNHECYKDEPYSEQIAIEVGEDITQLTGKVNTFTLVHGDIKVTKHHELMHGDGSVEPIGIMQVSEDEVTKWRG